MLSPAILHATVRVNEQIVIDLILCKKNIWSSKLVIDLVQVDYFTCPIVLLSCKL